MLMKLFKKIPIEQHFILKYIECVILTQLIIQTKLNNPPG